MHRRSLNSGEIDREYRDMGTNAYRPGGRHDTSSASGKGGAAAGPGDAGAEGETSYSGREDEHLASETAVFIRGMNEK